MSVMLTCPECRTKIEITDDLLDQPVRCHRCLHIFERTAREQLALGVQAGAPTKAPEKATPREEERPEPRRPSEPHSPFPIMPILIVALGVVFLMLVCSLGFNIWFVWNPEGRFRPIEEARKAEERARQQQIIAEQEAQRAAAMQAEGQRRAANLQREIEALQRQLEATREQLEEARRKVEK